MVRLIRKNNEWFEVTIDHKLFATFRGATAMRDAIVCADNLINNKG